MNDPFESRLRESLGADAPEPAIMERAIESGLRRRRANRSMSAIAGVALLGVVTLAASWLSAPPATRALPDKFSMQPVVQRVVRRVDIPVFSRPISAADRSTSWTILSIEGAIKR